MPLLTVRERVRSAAALDAAVGVLRRSPIGRRRTPSPHGRPAGAPGTVILPFGRYFASRVDMLTRDGFKTIVPIDGISPFSGRVIPTLRCSTSRTATG